MGLTTELRALIAGKDDKEIDAAFASVGFVPSGKVIDAEEIKTQAKSEGLEEGKAGAKAEESERVKEIMEKCRISSVTSPGFIAEILALSPEEAGQKIIDAQADESLKAEIFSNVNPMHNGGENPLVADAQKRREV